MIKLISHRGNLNGPNEKENDPNYITLALNEGFDVEIDLRLTNDGLYLGHDFPQYKVSQEFLQKQELWIHCKNIEALQYCKKNNFSNNYFWHQEDDVTLTSNGLLWTYPGKALTEYSIAVLPEIVEFANIEIAFGICSDFIHQYK